MMKKEDNQSPLNDVTERENQEQLSQKALGNTSLDEHNNDDESLSIPKTSGTGAIPAAPAPESLIVHEDKEGDERYESGSQEEDSND